MKRKIRNDVLTRTRCDKKARCSLSVCLPVCLSNSDSRSNGTCVFGLQLFHFLNGFRYLYRIMRSDACGLSVLSFPLTLASSRQNKNTIKLVCQQKENWDVLSVLAFFFPCSSVNILFIPCPCPCPHHVSPLRVNKRQSDNHLLRGRHHLSKSVTSCPSEGEQDRGQRVNREAGRTMREGKGTQRS